MENKKHISKILKQLNYFNIDFIILRKQDSIFENYGDIDLLVSFKSKKILREVFRNSKFLYYKDSKFTNVYLYKSIPHEHYYNKKLNINFDFSFDISYRSLNNKEFVPIDDSILKNIWEKKIKVKYDDFYFFQMDEESQLIHLICHCIFDKNKFSEYYCEKVNELLSKINKKTFLEISQPFFYKYSENLYDLLSDKNYEDIFEEYLSFKEY